ncbi:MAG: hypothetical protein ACT6RD_03160 [Brevundimonas sp.]|uniref:hypothetical protein n=1 Tax=Brevundimonas sp. TaxID=1871086 RepID=UPI004034263F
MSRAKPRARRNRPVIPLTPQEAAEVETLRARILARLEVMNAEMIDEGWIRCPDCGGLSPPETDAGEDEPWPG